MIISQTFETTVFNNETEAEGRFIVIPAMVLNDLPRTREAYHQFAEFNLFNSLKHPSMKSCG